MEYRVEIRFTEGLGTKKLYGSFDSYKAMTETTENFIAENHNKSITVLGYNTVRYVEKVIYSFPSGKKFIKKF